jgi:tRNA(fMet)-specific endonuclease VapC
LVCLDTDLLVALLRGEPRAVSSIKKLEGEGEHLATSAISAYELLKGAIVSSRRNENLKLVEDLLSSIPILPVSLKSSEASATIYGELASKGRIIGELDILIAGICAYNDELLVSNDRHFQEIGRMLNLVSW